MIARVFRLAVAAIALGYIFAPAAMAQGRRAPMARPPHPARVERPGRAGSTTPIDQFATMPPEQQRRELDRLPPGKREKLQQRIDRFNNLPPEQQRTLRNLYNRLHQLPPERQDAVRKAINRFSKQSPDRQQAIREELRGMASLSDTDRDARLSGREFRKKFSRREQEIVRDMSELVGARD
jgi:hypothetical protein